MVIQSKNLVKKPTKKTLLKQSCRNQLVQNGTLVKLDMGAKKPYGGFLMKNFGKKNMISCGVVKNN
jgi:hypothetical protein